MTFADTLLDDSFILQILHNGPLSQDAVRAELDFVHCGSYPLSGMEKISLLLGLQCMFGFSVFLTLCGLKFSEAGEGLLSVLMTVNAALVREMRSSKQV